MKSLGQLNVRLVNLRFGGRLAVCGIEKMDFFIRHFLLYLCTLHGDPNFRGTTHENYFFFHH